MSDGLFMNYKKDERKDLEDKATIEETAEAGDEIEITHYKLSILRRLRDSEDDIIDYPIETILDTYLDQLKNLSEPYEMSDAEYRRYNMRPDLFCYDKYGAPDLDFIVLMVNGINDEKEFNKKIIRYINPEYINEALSYIINAEQEYLENNRSSYEDSTFY